MGTMGDFATKMGKQRDLFEDNVNRKTRRMGLTIDTLIVQAMPVDTGRAKSSVITSIGSPSFLETTQARYPGKKGSTAGANARASIDQAKTVLNSRRIGEEIHITINIPYINRLNQGYSPQAKPDFIQTAIKDAMRDSEGVTVLLK